ncbi:hypothetical protein G9A89_006685 [Geosiphon pyriformis]|nr:hypothetical protein G9A89_006685 [Geosiphon pyriformis]
MKNSVKGAIHGPVGSVFTQKIRNMNGNIKNSSNQAVFILNKSSFGGSLADANRFENMKTDSEEEIKRPVVVDNGFKASSKSKALLDFQTNSSKAKRPSKKSCP